MGEVLCEGKSLSLVLGWGWCEGKQDIMRFPVAPFDVRNHIRGHMKHFEPGRGRRVTRKAGLAISCGLDFSGFPGACRQSRLLGEGHRSWTAQPPILMPTPLCGTLLSKY